MENRKRACSAPAGPSDAEHRNKRQALADDKQPAAAHAPPSALIGAQARADVYNQALTVCGILIFTRKAIADRRISLLQTQTRKNSAVELSTPGAYATPNTMLLLRSLAGMVRKSMGETLPKRSDSLRGPSAPSVDLRHRRRVRDTC